MKRILTAGAFTIVGFLAVFVAVLSVGPLIGQQVASAQEAGAPGFLEAGKAYTVRVAGVCSARMKVLEVQSGGWVKAEGIDGCLLRTGVVGWWNVNTGQAIKVE